MNVVIFDYRAGNLHSLQKALARTGVAVQLETEPERAAAADVLVLPGVGAFGPAATRLAPGLAALRTALQAGLPCLGICLGMQLLFDGSEEGSGSGIGLFSGPVTRLKSHRVPQIGWNILERSTESLAVAAQLATAYFANAYVCRPGNESVVTAWAEHEGDVFPAIVRRGNVVGTQFHPEKSSAAGLRFIEQFIQECAR